MAERTRAIAGDQRVRSARRDVASNGAKSTAGRGTPRWYANLWHANLWHAYPSTGIVGGIIGFGVSLLPSLIPRPWLVQAAFSGVTAALAYGIGVLLGWLVRHAGVHPEWSERTRRTGRIVLVLSGVATAVTLTALGAHWQSELRRLLDMPGVRPGFVLVPVVAAVVAGTLILLGRSARALARLLARALRRWVSPVLVRVGSGAMVAVLVVLIFNGTFMASVVQVIDSVAAGIETRDNGVVQPQRPERSGSPDSLVAWESLGAEGKAFVAGGPAPQRLAEFARRREPSAEVEVQVPVRIYAETEEFEDRDTAAQMVIDELDRSRAWERDVLVVATPAGNGQVSEAAIEAIELMHAGDTATAALGYTSMGSWLSFLTDRHSAPDAGQALFEAVYAHWSELPRDDRPALLVFGESLGSYGGHGAFSGLQDMVARTGGALWVATPRFTDIWDELTRARDAGSPEIHPIYDGGRQVRWGSGNGDATDLWDLGPEWEQPRVVYLQHASDGVVWWSSDLLWHEPDWLREPSGADVLPGLRWFPVLTYWLTTMDTLVAADVPVGYGHVYLQEYADAWAAIAPPAGWTDDDTDALKEWLVDVHRQP
ncbi:alpha/beta hydrolase [Phytoactinopolyspora halotolerans]|uniref:Alpha/beta-hydrolase family protein n=1 Tax=Phytoactinopolyspora halotolerans TaxID=1981512 RepID=A0A6L9S7U3_9ACTN|nr:alpha/beta hydrolase [Phytoactinopolyspora halotolerans]NEE00714.1 hypothetical protein [Phytoactinopolyspora halotolerans]